jgi:hypothetical protein
MKSRTAVASKEFRGCKSVHGIVLSESRGTLREHGEGVGQASSLPRTRQAAAGCGRLEAYPTRPAGVSE